MYIYFLKPEYCEKINNKTANLYQKNLKTEKTAEYNKTIYSGYSFRLSDENFRHVY